MHVFGSSVLTSSVFAWSHRALTVAMETGARLVAGVAAVASGGRPVEQRPVEVTAPLVSRGGPPQPPGTVAGQAPETAATAAAQEQRSVPTYRAAPEPVTPAIVRSWAREQGIQVADRGRIPRAVMEQYVAALAPAVAVTHRTSRSSATGPRPPSSGRSRSSAA